METLSTTEVASGAGDREPTAGSPVRYPTASSPQAWATRGAVPVAADHARHEPDRGKVILNPDVPKQCGKIVMRGVHAFGQRFDVTGEGRMGGVGPAGSAG